MLLLKSLFLDKMVIEAAKPSGSEKETRCSEIWRSCKHEPGTGHFPWRKTYGNGESCGPGQRRDSPAGVGNRNNFLVLPQTSGRITDTGCAQQPSPQAVCPTCLCSSRDYGCMGLSMMAVPGTAQRCLHERLSLRCRRSLTCLCLGCFLCNGDNCISHGLCGNAAINTRETEDYAVLALSVILFSVTARLIDSSNAGFRVLGLHRLAKKKAVLSWSNSQTSLVNQQRCFQPGSRAGHGQRLSHLLSSRQHTSALSVLTCVSYLKVIPFFITTEVRASITGFWGERLVQIETSAQQ